jgi:Yip1 domain
MRGTVKYLAGALRRPLRTFEKLLADPDRMRIGVASMLVMAALYLLVCVFLAVLHGTPNPAPFLRIPSEEYFYWAQYFYVPVLLLGMVLAGGVMYLLARFSGGQGSADDTFALAAYATAVATLPILLHDLFFTFIQIVGLMKYQLWFYSVTHGGVWFYVAWIFLLMYCAYFFVLYPIVVRVVHRLRWAYSILIGSFGFVVYQGFIFVFIR